MASHICLGQNGPGISASGRQHHQPTAWPPCVAWLTKPPDAGLLSPELAAGISRVKGVKQLGFRSGNWLEIRHSAHCPLPIRPPPPRNLLTALAHAAIPFEPPNQGGPFFPSPHPTRPMRAPRQQF